jgi:hypothetical protein
MPPFLHPFIDPSFFGELVRRVPAAFLASTTSSVLKAVNTMSTIDALAWLRDDATVRAHMRAHDVARRIDAGNGFVRITSVLPKHVAEGCSAMLAAHNDWEAMSDGEVSDRPDSVHHNFQFAEPEDHLETLQVLASAVALLFADLVPSFSVAKYGRGDSIAPHDDKAHMQLSPLGGGAKALHSRKYAAILYLSRGWKAKFGGALIDLEGCAEHVPSFNSLVVFAVPRMHAVAPVLTDSRPRFSVFGWWLEPGKLYELDDDVPPEPAEEEYADVEEILRQQQRAQQPTRQHKRARMAHAAAGVKKKKPRMQRR